MNKRSTALTALAVIIVSASLAPRAQAQITQTALFVQAVYEQSSTAAPTLEYFNFDVWAAVAAVSDFSSLSLTYPGGSATPTYGPVAGSGGGLGLSGPAQALVTGSFSTLSALNDAFPFGPYTVSGSGGTSASQSAPFTYSSNDLPTSVPTLTAASYTALQNTDASDALTIQFEPFTATDGYLIIVNSSYQSVFQSSGFLTSSSSPTSITIPAGTFQPGTQYYFELEFWNELTGTTSSVQNLEQFENFMYAPFETAAAVPLPAAAWLLLSGLAGLGALGRRRAHS